MAPSTEILVHISGPSRGSDDARYRREVRNYLQFKAGTRHVLLSNSNREDEDDEDDGASGDVCGMEQDEESDYGDADFSQLETPGPKIAPPALPTVENYKLDSLKQAGANIWRTPSAPKSKLLRSYGDYTPGSAPMLKNASVVQVSRTPVVQVARTPSDRRPYTAPQSAECSQEIPSLRSTQSDSWGPGLNEIPDSQPSLPNLKRPLNLSSPSPSQRSTSRSPKRQRRSLSPSVDPPLQNSRCPTLPANKPITVQSPILTLESPPQPTPPTPKSPRVPRSPMAIRPSPPTPGMARFETHLTPSLKVFLENLPLQIFYTPFQLRDAIRPLQIHERGHWRLPTSSFAPEVKIKSWSYLERFIGENCAGWGVWCVIETEPRTKRQLGIDNKKGEEEKQVNEKKQPSNEEPPNGDETNSDGTDPSAQEIWKFYCWGEQVPAIWLLIFMATNRKVKGCAAAWLDAREEVVVLMR